MIAVYAVRPPQGNRAATSNFIPSGTLTRFSGCLMIMYSVNLCTREDKNYIHHKKILKDDQCAMWYYGKPRYGNLYFMGNTAPHQAQLMRQIGRAHV